MAGVNTNHTNIKQGDFFGELLQTSPSGIIAYEAIRQPGLADQPGAIVDFRAVFFNLAYEQIFNEPAEAIQRRNFRERFSDEIHTDLFPFYVHLVETGASFRRERFYPHLNKWLDLSGTKLLDGFLLVINDISDRKRAEQQLQQTNDLLEGLLNGSMNGMYALRPVRDEQTNIIDFQITRVNRAGAQLANVPPERLEGQLLSACFPGYREAGLMDSYVRVVETGAPFRQEIHYPYDGLDNWFVLAVEPFSDGIVLSFVDVTQQKQQADALRLANQELARSNESLQQFAYVASHDLQEPLRKIISFSTLIHDQYASQLDEQGADLVERLQSAATRMQALIRDVLAFSRLTVQPEAFQTVDMGPLLQGVLDDLEAMIEERNAVIHVAQMNHLKGDPAQLRQLFQNLLSNALKFTRPGVVPKINMTCRTLPGRECRLQLPQALHGIWYDQIEVIDNGQGFKPEQATQIFQVFHRLHGRSDQYGGTGIGLAIVQKVVANHQGFVMAEGRPDEGATFVVLLPTGRPS
ncbi:ATP-binding protein [Spirosoma soli]|uniref:histidine kinase n=1 Tax=Spirosoma soli TaxID=1770529 RepID=A0ABW5M560_9BACT